MAVTVRAASVMGAAEGATGFDITTPAGTTSGDLVLLVLFVDVEATQPPTAVGFTQVGDDSVAATGTTAGGRITVLSKTAGGSEPGVYDVNDVTGNASSAGVVMAITGHDAGSPIDVNPAYLTSTSTTASHVAPSISPTAAGGLALFGYCSGTAGGGSYTPGGSGLTEVGDATSASWRYGAVYSLAIAAGGATGTKTVTSSASTDEHKGVSLAVRAAGSTQPTLVSDRGSTANATAATTSSVTLTSPTSIAVGNYLLARVAVDNSGTNGAAPGCTVTDPRSNTWTVLGPALVDPGAANAGATAYLAYTRVTTAYQAADALTFNWGGISTTAKAIVVEEWSNIRAASPVAVSAVTANAAASTTVQVSITPTAPNQLVYTCLATEGIAGDTVGADADTTNGTWNTLTTTASANATATNNQRVSGQYKIVTASGAQSWDSTITSRDWAALAVVFSPLLPSIPPVQPIRRLQPLLVR